MASPFVSTYTSFSGADLVVSFGPTVIGELQQLSYAIQREKVPVFTLGSPNPRSFSRGKRGIAGSLVFAAFDRDSLLEEMKKNWSLIAPPAMYTAAGNIAIAKTENFGAMLDVVRWNAAAQSTYTAGIKYKPEEAPGVIKGTTKPDGWGLAVGYDGTTSYIYEKSKYTATPQNYDKIVDEKIVKVSWDELTSQTADTYGFVDAKNGAAFGVSGTGAINKLNDFAGNPGPGNTATTIKIPPGFKSMTAENIQYVDQLPPFDITLTFANEYGQAAFQKIYDLEILNESSGVSVDSVIMERNYTWIGRNISPLYKGIYTRESNGSVVQYGTDGKQL